MNHDVRLAVLFDHGTKSLVSEKYPYDVALAEYVVQSHFLFHKSRVFGSSLTDVSHNEIVKDLGLDVNVAVQWRLSAPFGPDPDYNRYRKAVRSERARLFCDKHGPVPRQLVDQTEEWLGILQPYLDDSILQLDVTGIVREPSGSPEIYASSVWSWNTDNNDAQEMLLAAHAIKCRTTASVILDGVGERLEFFDINFCWRLDNQDKSAVLRTFDEVLDLTASLRQMVDSEEP